jgi:ketosteroid isomerase-like protein
MTLSLQDAADCSALRKLNDVYIRSVQTSDVSCFKELLADDFQCALPNGSLVDKVAFLEHVSRPASLSNLKAHDVEVCLLGDVAIIHARTTFRNSDGQMGASRYTDVWARRHGRWQAISAHVTRY